MVIDTGIFMAMARVRVIATVAVIVRVVVKIIVVFVSAMPILALN